MGLGARGVADGTGAGGVEVRGVREAWGVRDVGRSLRPMGGVRGAGEFAGARGGQWQDSEG